MLKTGIVMYEQADKDQKEQTRKRLEAYEKSLKEKAKEKKSEEEE